ncbi:MAG: isocitrate lyase, partial [Methanobacteriota archaeon]
MATETVELEQEWRTSDRWAGILRPYGAADVERLRGSIRIRHTLAELGAERLWELLRTEDY